MHNAGFCNAELETQVLAALVHLNEDPRQYHLVPDDFGIPENRQAFRIILGAWHKNQVLTPEVFLEAMKARGMGETAMNIIEAYFPATSFGLQVKRLKEFSRKRHFHNLSQKFLEGKISEKRLQKIILAMAAEGQNTLPEPIHPDALLNDDCPQPILGSFLFRGSIHLLSSDPGVGKTTFCYALAVALAKGGSFLGEELPKLRVGLFDLETPASLRSMKLKTINGTPGDGLLFFDQACQVESLKALVKKYRLDFLIIDTMSLFFALRKEEDNSEVNEKITRPLKELAKETKVAVLLVHHNSKGAKERSRVYRSRGASALPGGVDVVMSLENTNDEEVLKLEVTKNRLSGYTPTLYLQKDEGSFAVVEMPDSEFSKTQRAEKAIIQLLKIEKTASLRLLCNSIGFASEKTVRIAIGNLLTIGKVVKVDRGCYALSPESGNASGEVRNSLPFLPDVAENRMGSGKESGNVFGKESGKLPNYGSPGNDTSPHTQYKRDSLANDEYCVWGNSITIPTKTFGDLPNRLPNRLPDSNPHESRLPDTSGNFGNQFDTLPKEEASTLEGRGRNPLIISPPTPRVKWKYHGVI